MKHTPFFFLFVALILFGASCEKLPSISRDPNTPDLRIKHLGVNIGAFDAATGTAGDFKYTKDQLGGLDRPMLEYGYVIPGANTSSRLDKANPQPTFTLPLGSKVYSLVDGVVIRIETLYSKDVSIMVASSKDSEWVYELEHVLNPIVKVGDRVTAGQELAEVSTHDSQYYPGYGLVEIGILHAGKTPEHVCPFDYLDPAVKDRLLGQVRGLMSSWETYRNDQTIYDEAAMPVQGCVTRDRIEG